MEPGRTTQGKRKVVVPTQEASPSTSLTTKAPSPTKAPGALNESRPIKEVLVYKVTLPEGGEPETPASWKTTFQRVLILLAEQGPGILLAVAYLVHW